MLQPSLCISVFSVTCCVFVNFVVDLYDDDDDDDDDHGYDNKKHDSSSNLGRVQLASD